MEAFYLKMKSNTHTSHPRLGKYVFWISLANLIWFLDLLIKQTLMSSSWSANSKLRFFFFFFLYEACHLHLHPRIFLNHLLLKVVQLSGTLYLFTFYWFLSQIQRFLIYCVPRFILGISNFFEFLENGRNSIGNRVVSLQNQI